MRTFMTGQRVVVDQPEAYKALRGKVGTVKRCRRGDDGAWVRMDDPIPDEMRLFPADDEHGRGNDVLLYPEECMPERQKVTPNAELRGRPLADGPA